MEGADLLLPPGFRFHPTDEELVMHYLCRKCAGMAIPVPIVAEVDIYKYDPWQLPRMARYGEKEWYFFTPRDRKYPNGSRPNRAAGSGYWKATGADKPVGVPKPVAIKKALVFYSGKAPRGEKSNWIMHEYRLAGVDRSVRKKQSLRLDEWVLCRIYNKKGSAETPASPDRRPAVPRGIRPEPKPEVSNTHVPPAVQPAASLADYFTFDAAESLPRLMGDSSCSEHVPSPDFACDREVQSQPNWGELERAFELPGGDIDPVASYLDAGGPLADVFGDPMQDMLMYLQKPF